jgi:hypothetical protein
MKIASIETREYLPAGYHDRGETFLPHTRFERVSEPEVEVVVTYRMRQSEAESFVADLRKRVQP